MIVVFTGKATVIRIVKQLLRRIKREFLLPLCKVKMKTHHRHRDRVIEQKRTDDGAGPVQGGPTWRESVRCGRPCVGWVAPHAAHRDTSPKLHITMLQSCLASRAQSLSQWIFTALPAIA